MTAKDMALLSPDAPGKDSVSSPPLYAPSKDSVSAPSPLAPSPEFTGDVYGAPSPWLPEAMADYGGKNVSLPTADYYLACHT